ncbi:hypothetical protein ABBQ38_007839 [Trebouxia sp. C0009 RCD-2024]
MNDQHMPDSMVPLSSAADPQMALGTTGAHPSTPGPDAGSTASARAALPQKRLVKAASTVDWQPSSLTTELICRAGSAEDAKCTKEQLKGEGNLPSSAPALQVQTPYECRPKESALGEQGQKKKGNKPAKPSSAKPAEVKGRPGRRQ